MKRPGLVAESAGPLSNLTAERRYKNVLPNSETPAVTMSAAGPDSFDEFFAAHYASLTRMIYRVVGDIDCAEELASEAFWKLHSKPPSSGRNVVGWLYRTALHLAFDNLKKRKRRAHYEALASPVAVPQDPEETLERNERQGRVRQVLLALKPERAALLVLRSEGHTLSEIACILDMNPSSVGTLLARADKAFRKEYVNRYGER
jgi:RNA polymerase sigma-70 factor, ECF subfamily